jgi:hypothetical protein
MCVASRRDPSLKVRSPYITTAIVNNAALSEDYQSFLFWEAFTSTPEDDAI